MTPSLVYLVRIYGLKLPSTPASGVPLLPGLLLTNDFRGLEKHLDRGFFKVIGDLETSDLQNAETVAYTLGDAANLQRAKLTPNDFILLTATHISVLLHGLWLVKDHSAYPGLGFVQVCDGKNISVHSNQLASNFTTSTGQRSTVALTTEELNRASDFIKKLLPLFRYDFRLRHSPTTALLGSQRDAKRLSRAIYFTSVARAVNDLGIKIVNYCTALETLFSTDATELTYKVSQRTSVFLGGSVEEKMSIHDLVKKAYGVRSKVVHGDGLRNDAVEKIMSVSEELDSLVRRILLKIFSSEETAKHFEMGRDELDRFFLRESFS
jgi:hypothetical protein